MTKETKPVLSKNLLVAAVIAVIAVGALALYMFLPGNNSDIQNAKDSGTQEAMPKNVIATIGDISISEQELGFAAVDLARQFEQVPAELRKAAVLNALIDIRVLARAAEESGLAKTDEFKARVGFLRSRALHNAYFKQNAVDTVTEEVVRERYDKELALTKPEREVDARHILVKTEEEANEIIAQLDTGMDFAELAKAKSIGPSGANGGTLGYFTKGKMVPEFANAAFAQETGSYSKTPVKTQFGWHIIFKIDERDTQPPTFEESESSMRQIVLREKYIGLVDAGREKFKVEILDEELKKGLDKLNTSQ